MVEPVTIGFGTNKWLKDSSTQFIALYRPSNAGGTLTYNNQGSAYLVPAGHVYIILGSSFDGSVHTITYDPVLNNYGTTVWQSSGATADINLPMWIEIPAGNYVNISVSGSNIQGAVWGIETTV